MAQLVEVLEQEDSQPAHQQEQEQQLLLQEFEQLVEFQLAQEFPEYPKYEHQLTSKECDSKLIKFLEQEDTQSMRILL